MTRANQITNGVLQICRAFGFEAWRQNNGGVWDAKLKRYRANSVGRKGVADVIGWHKRTGAFLAVEVKAGKDRLSTDQRSFLQGVKKAGGFSFVARGVGDFHDEIKKELERRKML